MTLRPEPYLELRTERVWTALDGLGALAAEQRTSMAALALAWLLAQPQVTAVVVGPRRPEHLAPALEAVTLDLSQSDAAAIGALFA